MHKIVQLSLGLFLVVSCRKKDLEHSSDSVNSRPKPDTIVLPDKGSDPVAVPVPVTSADGKANPETTPTPIPKPTGAAVDLSMPPQGCTGTGSVTANDFVLFQGEALAGTTNALAFPSGWKGEEVWDNGRLQFEAKETGSLLTFGNEGIYHGFKLSPPTLNGARKNFTFVAAEIWLDSVRTNPNGPIPSFGLRVIKPQEFEGNGGAATTTWLLDNATNGSRFFNVPASCSLLVMRMPQAFLDQKSVGNRLIWEMQSNWTPVDLLRIRRVVLKGFQFLP